MVHVSASLRGLESETDLFKWIPVASFGYLGYRNVRFGKGDSYIAIPAFPGYVPLKKSESSGNRGFDVVHGIISLLFRDEVASLRMFE